MLLNLSPVWAAALVILTVAVIGTLIGLLVSAFVPAPLATMKRFLSILAGILTAVILGLLVWVLVVSGVTFSPVRVAPVVVSNPNDLGAPYVAQPLAPAGSLPSQQPQPSGFCQSKPVNPQDGVNVALKSGLYHVIEEYDNTLAIPIHQFHVYNVDTQGDLNVWATADSGMRAWECTSEDAAFETAYASARGYKLQHPDHLVIRPDGLEEVSK